MGKRVAVIGAGVGGLVTAARLRSLALAAGLKSLALAARLLSRGYSVDVYEKLSRCAGRAIGN